MEIHSKELGERNYLRLSLLYEAGAVPLVLTMTERPEPPQEDLKPK